jgi:predicted transposase/invertase (TIGR01784 family)
MVWRIDTHDNEALNVCLLLEHKSYPDANVAFQMLEYIALGYQTQLKNKQGLELILPILYYHGQEKWQFKAMSAHFEHLPTHFQPYIPKYETVFMNLNELSQSQIQNLQHGLLRAALLLQSNYFNPEKLNNSVRNILESLNPYLELNPTDFIFVYLIQNGHLNKARLEESIKILPTPFPNKVMSIYDELIQEGFERGIAEGIEKGIEKGIAAGIEKGIEKTVLNAFDNGVSLELIRIITGESPEKIEEILKKNRK